MYISSFDINDAYRQIPVHPDHQWLAMLIWDGGLYEFTHPLDKREVVIHSCEPCNMLCNHYIQGWIKLLVGPMPKTFGGPSHSGSLAIVLFDRS